MLTKGHRRAYGIGKPLVKMAPDNIISKRDPSVKDRSEVGAKWIKNDGSHKAVYINAGVLNGDTQWQVLSYDLLSSTIASPTAAATMNGYKGFLKVTGFTTAAGASQVLTINNSYVKAGDNVIVTINNNDAGGSEIYPLKVATGAGTIGITFVNDGVAALASYITVYFSLI